MRHKKSSVMAQNLQTISGFSLAQAERLVGTFLVQTAGYHKGEVFECTSVMQKRGAVYLYGLWDCGTWIYERVEGSTLAPWDGPNRPEWYS